MGRFFLDTEFAEKPHTIKLISIRVVSENGREFYAEASDFDPSCANEWVNDNVIPQLWHRQKDKSQFNAWSRDGGSGGLLKTAEIGPALQR